MAPRFGASMMMLVGQIRPKLFLPVGKILSKNDVIITDFFRAGCEALTKFHASTSAKLKHDAFWLWQPRSLNFQWFSDPSEIRWRVRGAREAPAPRDSLNFRRASFISRNEFESGTFTIVLHATSSFRYVSVIYGANFPFKVFETSPRSPTAWCYYYYYYYYYYYALLSPIARWLVQRVRKVGDGERWVKKGRGLKVQWMEHGESRQLRWKLMEGREKVLTAQNSVEVFSISWRSQGLSKQW